MIDILDTWHIEKAHFCGISMGGITALTLAIQYPERFYSITVANSAAKIGTAEAWNSRADSVEQDGLAEIVKPHIPVGLVGILIMHMMCLLKKPYKV